MRKYNKTQSPPLPQSPMNTSKTQMLIFPSSMPPSTPFRVNAMVFAVIDHALLRSLSCGLLTPVFYSSHWILLEMSQKSVQPILASSQCWWILPWSLKHGPNQPSVLGFLSLLLSFLLDMVAGANLAEKVDLCSFWLWLSWPNSDCLYAVPSRSFSYQHGELDRRARLCVVNRPAE